MHLNFHLVFQSGYNLFETKLASFLNWNNGNRFKISFHENRIFLKKCMFHVEHRKIKIDGRDVVNFYLKEKLYNKIKKAPH